MVTLNKSWSGSTSLTISAVKETWQLHRVGCPFTGEGGRSRKPQDSRGIYKQLYTSGEELNLKGILICLWLKWHRGTAQLPILSLLDFKLAWSSSVQPTHNLSFMQNVLVAHLGSSTTRPKRLQVWFWVHKKCRTENAFVNTEPTSGVRKLQRQSWTKELQVSWI